MLVGLKEILDIAQKSGTAIGAFNATTSAALMAEIEAAEELQMPVIVMHCEGHDGLIPLEYVGAMMRAAAEKASVPVCVHLDHGETVDYVKRAIDVGFTGVMFDGSTKPFDENMDCTRQVVEAAKKTGASVEAELGCLGKRELGYGEAVNDGHGDKKIYTDPAEAERFVNETGIDALACSFGTAHGMYITKPKLDFTVLDRIKERVSIPLVMHGGSGISPDNFREAIRHGIRKVNYFTYLDIAGGEAVADEIKVNLAREEVRPVYYHEVAMWAKEGMKKNAVEALKIFSMR